jgi:hypothetical protein
MTRGEYADGEQIGNRPNAKIQPLVQQFVSQLAAHPIDVMYFERMAAG